MASLLEDNIWWIGGHLNQIDLLNLQCGLAQVAAALGVSRSGICLIILLLRLAKVFFVILIFVVCVFGRCVICCTSHSADVQFVSSADCCCEESGSSLSFFFVRTKSLVDDL